MTWAFSHWALLCWNSLPSSLQHSSSIAAFKSALKTHLFSSKHWIACYRIWLTCVLVHASVCVCVCVCVREREREREGERERGRERGREWECVCVCGCMFVLVCMPACVCACVCAGSDEKEQTGTDWQSTCCMACSVQSNISNREQLTWIMWGMACSLQSNNLHG